MGLAGLLGGTAGALVLLNTPQKTFLHLVPWLLLVAALIFAASGPVSRWLDRRKRAAGKAAASRRAGCRYFCARSCLLLHRLLRRGRGIPADHAAFASSAFRI